MSTRVLPEPAGAITRAGPDGWVTAASWSGASAARGVSWPAGTNDPASTFQRWTTAIPSSAGGCGGPPSTKTGVPSARVTSAAPPSCTPWSANRRAAFRPCHHTSRRRREHRRRWPRPGSAGAPRAARTPGSGHRAGRRSSSCGAAHRRRHRARSPPAGAEPRPGGGRPPPRRATGVRQRRPGRAANPTTAPAPPVLLAPPRCGPAPTGQTDRAALEAPEQSTERLDHDRHPSRMERPTSDRANGGCVGGGRSTAVPSSSARVRSNPLLTVSRLARHVDTQRKGGIIATTW